MVVEIAAKLVHYHCVRLPELPDQPDQKTSGVAARLDHNVESIAVGIDSTPKPVLHAVDRDSDFIYRDVAFRRKGREAYDDRCAMG